MSADKNIFYIYLHAMNRYSTFLEAKFKVSESRMEYLTGDLCHCIWLILILILFAFNISGIILNPLWNWESEFSIANCRLIFQKPLRWN